MAIVQKSIRAITRCHFGPTRLGNMLARWAQQHYHSRLYRNVPYEVVVTHMDRGMRMKVVPTHHIGGAIYWRGAYAHRILKCIAEYLRPEMTFIDVGANQGEVSLFAARRLSEGRVIAFEPDAANFSRMLDNVALNELTNIVARNHCLGENYGEAELYVPCDEALHHSDGWNEGLSSMFSSRERVSTAHGVVVQPLDDVVVELGLDRIDLVKIDVEGAELPVLQGSKELLRRFSPVLVVEINAETFRHAGYAALELCDYLHNLNYEGYLIDRNGRRSSRVSTQVPDHCDTVWLPINRTRNSAPWLGAQELGAKG